MLAALALSARKGELGAARRKATRAAIGRRRCYCCALVWLRRSRFFRESMWPCKHWKMNGE